MGSSVIRNVKKVKPMTRETKYNCFKMFRSIEFHKLLYTKLTDTQKSNKGAYIISNAEFHLLRLLSNLVIKLQEMKECKVFSDSINSRNEV